MTDNLTLNPMDVHVYCLYCYLSLFATSILLTAVFIKTQIKGQRNVTGLKYNYCNYHYYIFIGNIVQHSYHQYIVKVIHMLT